MRQKRGGSKHRMGRRVSAWLAFASLLIQLVVTTGHFHREDLAFYGAALGAGQGSPAVAQRDVPVPALPSHDDCPLCFNLRLAGSSAMPVPVALPLPAALGAVALKPLTELRLTAAPHLLFRSRAPPIA